MAKALTNETLFRAVEESVHSVFKEQRYEVPFYQRPYAWDVENAEELFEDLYTASLASGKNASSYFLGSIVLFDSGKGDRHKIIDGQQRLVTLQLLLLALATEITDTNYKEELLSYIRSKENVFAGTKSEPVVKIGDRYQNFFAQLIYDPSKISDDYENLSGPETLLLKNYRYFQNKIATTNNIDPVKFGVFVMQRCIVASLRAHHEQSALRIFTVLNDRGVDLHPVDILKAQLISNAGVTEQDMERYARDWEEDEFSLGREEFLNLFNYIRMIFVKSRTKRLLHEEILDELDTKPKVKTFLDTELSDYCELYSELLNPKEAELRNIIKILEATNQKDWVAPALFMLKHKRALKDKFIPLMKRLAALSIMMLCTPFTEGQRVGRYGRVLVEITEVLAKKKTFSELKNILCSGEELSRIEQNLVSDAYSLRNVRAFLLWSETLVGDGGRSIEAGKMTVEHLLPNKVGTEPYWTKQFGREWETYSNHIGNLVLVSSKLNNDLGRRPFQEKKEIIKRRIKTGWVITDQALENEDWTPQLVKKRGEELIRRAKSIMKSRIG
jgi:uncharacterized protein with ParB-like and HNH nuclease domain